MLILFPELHFTAQNISKPITLSFFLLSSTNLSFIYPSTMLLIHYWLARTLAFFPFHLVSCKHTMSTILFSKDLLTPNSFLWEYSRSKNPISICSFVFEGEFPLHFFLIPNPILCITIGNASQPVLDTTYNQVMSQTVTSLKGVYIYVIPPRLKENFTGQRLDRLWSMEQNVG